MNRDQVLKIIGDDLRAEAAGQVRKNGPSMEQKLATAYGGKPEDYVHTVSYNQFAAQAGLLWNDERDAWIGKLLAQSVITRKPGYRRNAADFQKACELADAMPPSMRMPQSLNGAWASLRKDNAVPPGEYERKLRAQINAEKIADGLAFIRNLRSELDALKDTPEPELTPWEKSERERERAEALFEVASHEARHAVVGLFYGAKISEVIATARCGHVLYDHLPRKGDLAMTLAGSLWEHRRLREPSAEHDREQAEAAVAKEINRVAPEANQRDREYIRAQILMDAEICAEGIIKERSTFYYVLRDLLVERGKVSGREVHALWDEMYDVNGKVTQAGERHCREQYHAAKSRGLPGWR